MKRKAPWRDPIVEEIHRFREEWAAKFDYDPEKMYQELKRLEQENDGLYVSLRAGKLVSVQLKAKALTPDPHLTPQLVGSGPCSHTSPCVDSCEEGDSMATNLALDDSLIEEAVKVGNHRTKKEAVTAALQEYVQARKRREIFELVGKVDYYDDYDPKRLRDRKPR
jgi:Bacterial antitoxin of type II TA system, VapB